MKTLYLLRHAKSDWDSGGPDHDRTLAPRGVDAAQRIGRLLAEIGQIPDRVVSSSATRAQTTAQLAATAGNWGTDVETDRALYDTGPDDMLAWLRCMNDATISLMLVGHQPTWSLLAEGLIGGGRLRFPTAALARIDLHLEHWRETEFGHGELVWFQIPRVLKSLDWPPDL
jgi:phosphohistidine phosphatase